MTENYEKRKVGIATVCNTTMHFPREISMPSMQALLISVEKQANASLPKLREHRRWTGEVSTEHGIPPSHGPRSQRNFLSHGSSVRLRCPLEPQPTRALVGRLTYLIGTMVVRQDFPLFASHSVILDRCTFARYQAPPRTRTQLSSLRRLPSPSRCVDQKFHCSLVDQRKGRLKGRLTTRRGILWWNICAEIARKSGRFLISKLLIINKLTRWRCTESLENRSPGRIPC